ncbi:protein kinase [Myxococcota bacterium]|nr:protein kinase [Myxococcota bacterium]MBU1533855.1 protein kinase [Myxococcota bacterium]
MIPKGTCHHCFEEECSCSSTSHTDFSYKNPPYALAPGALLGEHFIIGPMIARGGFGLIYLAYQTNLRRRVAIKEYFPSKLSQRRNQEVVPLEGKESSFSKYRDLFFNEGPTLGRISHKNVVAVHDFVAANNTGYLVMEYLTGATADKLVLPGSLAIPTVLGISLSVLKGLGAIHSAGFLYLDLKPQNILVTKKGTIKLIDLGNTRRSDYDRTLIPVAHSRGYAAPEQIHPTEKLTRKADIYSFGATLYTLVTGNLPPTPAERLEAIQESGQDLEGLETLSAPPAGYEHTVKIIRKCMSLESLDRYNDLEEIRQDMGGLIHDLRLKAVTDPVSLENSFSIKEAENNLIVIGADSTQPPERSGSLRHWLLSVILLLGTLGALALGHFVGGWIPALLLSIFLSAAILKLLHSLMGRVPQTCHLDEWVLKGVRGEYSEFYLEIDRPITLGRDPDHCNLVFSSPHISRIHATLGVSEHGITITDNASSLGVKVNHEVIGPSHLVELHHQDRVQLGGQVFVVLNKRHTKL